MITRLGKTLFINQFINQLNRLKQESGRSATTEIELHSFCDVELDISGWYAIGHHHPEVFWQAVVNQDPSYPLQIQDVRIGWAKFDHHRFEFVTQPIDDFQPVTLIERSF